MELDFLNFLKKNQKHSTAKSKLNIHGRCFLNYVQVNFNFRRQ